MPRLSEVSCFSKFMQMCRIREGAAYLNALFEAVDELVAAASVATNYTKEHVLPD
jgi:hypothetical protein